MPLSNEPLAPSFITYEEFLKKPENSQAKLADYIAHFLLYNPAAEDNLQQFVKGLGCDRMFLELSANIFQIDFKEESDKLLQIVRADLQDQDIVFNDDGKFANLAEVKVKVESLKTPKLATHLFERYLSIHNQVWESNAAENSLKKFFDFKELAADKEAIFKKELISAIASVYSLALTSAGEENDVLIQMINNVNNNFYQLGQFDFDIKFIAYIDYKKNPGKENADLTDYIADYFSNHVWPRSNFKKREEGTRIASILDQLPWGCLELVNIDFSTAKTELLQRLKNELPTLKKIQEPEELVTKIKSLEFLNAEHYISKHVEVFFQHVYGEDGELKPSLKKIIDSYQNIDKEELKIDLIKAFFVLYAPGLQSELALSCHEHEHEHELELVLQIINKIKNNLVTRAETTLHAKNLSTIFIGWQNKNSAGKLTTLKKFLAIQFLPSPEIKKKITVLSKNLNTIEDKKSAPILTTAIITLAFTLALSAAVLVAILFPGALFIMTGLLVAVPFPAPTVLFAGISILYSLGIVAGIGHYIVNKVSIKQIWKNIEQIILQLPLKDLQPTNPNTKITEPSENIAVSTTLQEPMGPGNEKSGGKTKIIGELQQCTLLQKQQADAIEIWKNKKIEKKIFLPEDYMKLKTEIEKNKNSNPAIVFFDLIGKSPPLTPFLLMHALNKFAKDSGNLFKNLLSPSFSGEAFVFGMEYLLLVATKNVKDKKSLINLKEKLASDFILDQKKGDKFAHSLLSMMQALAGLELIKENLGESANIKFTSEEQKSYRDYFQLTQHFYKIFVALPEIYAPLYDEVIALYQVEPSKITSIEEDLRKFTDNLEQLEKDFCTNNSPSLLSSQPPEAIIQNLLSSFTFSKDLKKILSNLINFFENKKGGFKTKSTELLVEANEPPGADLSNKTFILHFFAAIKSLTDLRDLVQKLISEKNQAIESSTTQENTTILQATDAFLQKIQEHISSMPIKSLPSLKKNLDEIYTAVMQTQSNEANLDDIYSKINELISSIVIPITAKNLTAFFIIPSTSNRANTEQGPNQVPISRAPI
jgi:hypothetical protein